MFLRRGEGITGNLCGKRDGHQHLHDGQDVAQEHHASRRVLVAPGAAERPRHPSQAGHDGGEQGEHQRLRVHVVLRRSKQRGVGRTQHAEAERGHDGSRQHLHLVLSDLTPALLYSLLSEQVHAIIHGSHGDLREEREHGVAAEKFLGDSHRGDREQGDDGVLQVLDEGQHLVPRGTSPVPKRHAGGHDQEHAEGRRQEGHGEVEPVAQRPEAGVVEVAEQERGLHGEGRRCGEQGDLAAALDPRLERLVAHAVLRRRRVVRENADEALYGQQIERQQDAVFTYEEEEQGVRGHQRRAADDAEELDETDVPLMQLPVS